MQNALTYLEKLIDNGYDYADALYKTSTKFKISYTKIQSAYDNL